MNSICIYTPLPLLPPPGYNTAAWDKQNGFCVAYTIINQIARKLGHGNLPQCFFTKKYSDIRLAKHWFHEDCKIN